MPERNATEQDLAAYMRVFLNTLEETAAEYLSEQLRGQLWHTSLLPADVICYVSTQFGVAFEFKRSAETRIRTVGGSARVEDLLFRVPEHLRASGPMFSIAGSNVGIYDLTLQGGFPFRLRGAEASLQIGGVQFALGGEVREIEYAEVFGDRRASAWSEASAVSRAKDEVLAAATEVRRAEERGLEIAAYVGTNKQKTVLLLGSYSPEGRGRLADFAKELQRHDYDPVVVDEVPDHPHQDLGQKVTMLGSVSRFVVVDDSESSGHIAEIELCKLNRWVTAILRKKGAGSSWMTKGASTHSRVILETSYEPPPLPEAIDETVSWAEATLGEVSEDLTNTYPWRRGLSGNGS